MNKDCKMEREKIVGTKIICAHQHWDFYKGCFFMLHSIQFGCVNAKRKFHITDSLPLFAATGYPATVSCAYACA